MSQKDQLKQEIWEQSKEWIDGIGQVVNEMASKLGVATQHVYEVYTRQMFVEGVIAFTIGVLSIILITIFVLKYTIPAFKNENDTEFRFFSTIAVAVLLGISIFCRYT